MQLVQLFLPLEDNDGRPFPREALLAVHRELADRFGGVTAYLHSPALGAWKDAGETVRDRVVMFEVMTDTIDRSWWQGFREELERRFQQETLLVRALAAQRL